LEGHENFFHIGEGGHTLNLDRLEGHENAVLCVAVDARGKRIASGEIIKRDAYLFLVTLTGPYPMHVGGDNKKGDINGVVKVWDQTLTLTLTLTLIGVVKVWDIVDARRGHECIFTYKTHEKEVRAVSLSPDGSYLASGSKDGSIHFFHIGEGGHTLNLES